MSFTLSINPMTSTLFQVLIFSAKKKPVKSTCIFKFRRRWNNTLSPYWSVQKSVVWVSLLIAAVTAQKRWMWLTSQGSRSIFQAVTRRRGPGLRGAPVQNQHSSLPCWCAWPSSQPKEESFSSFPPIQQRPRAANTPRKTLTHQRSAPAVLATWESFEIS